VDGVIDFTVDYVEALSRSLGRPWPAIEAARASAEEVRQLLSEVLGEFSSDDLDIVVFGSLARGEWTSGSDIDWTLLIDGQASPDHRTVARMVRETIATTIFRGKKLPAPGTEGIFGNMAFSHDIVHHIGGQADTNRNTTQRILLLLEARAIRHSSHSGTLGPYDRVVRSILHRYLHDDTNFSAGGDDESRIPRFLLNDVVRYWRTMCVDFAYKEWEQAGSKWAMRNLKLRTFRKLLFVSGLLAIFSCYKNAGLRISGKRDETYIETMRMHLGQFVLTSPLNIVAWTLSQLGLSEECGGLLDYYDAFLSQLDDEKARAHLDALNSEKVYEDETFLRLREMSHGLQERLTEVFFQCETELQEFVIKYGVF
jgi:predicted nucleotidyltransferase